MNPHLAFSAVLALGLRGIRNKSRLPCPPISTANLSDSDATKLSFERLPNSLEKAAERMARKGSLAREVLGDQFVDHFAATRMNEWGIYARAVTDWELKRYFELA